MPNNPKLLDKGLRVGYTRDVIGAVKVQTIKDSLILCKNHLRILNKVLKNLK